MSLRKSNSIRLLLLGLLAVSCSPKYELWDGYEYVYDRNGRVEDYEIEKGKPFVVDYAVGTGILQTTLSETPKGKIDRIIRNNPEFEFVFYCACPLSDTTVLMSILNKYDCNYPVILDPGNVLKDKYYSDIIRVTYICDKSGNILDCSVIGSSLSFFDKVFAEVKNEMRH